jgi:hypothetical protein
MENLTKSKKKLDSINAECKMLSQMTEHMRNRNKTHYATRLENSLVKRQSEKKEAEANYLSALSKLN